MSEMQELSSLVQRRQAAALADYKEQISRLKEDNERQRKLLDAVLHPGARLFPTVLPKQLLVSKEEKQEWRPSVDQEQPEPPHVKEEQQELWASQEAEQLQDIKVPFTDVTVKSEDEEEAGPSQLHQSQTEESREAEPPASSSTVKMETEAAGEEPAENVDPAADFQPACNGQLLSSHSSDSEADGSEDDMEDTVNKNTRLKQWKCHVCGSSFKERQMLDMHMVIHNREKTFSCPFCGKGFSNNSNFNRHIRVHTGEKPFSCSVCHKRFSDKTYIKVHMTLHTGERPFSCSVCHKSFRDKTNLKVHMRGHTGKKPFSCSECDKSFSDKRSLRRHMQVHTGEKPFSCSECDKRFSSQTNMNRHMRVHTGEDQEQPESPHVKEEQPEPPRIKEEQQELWVSQEAEQLQDIKVPFTDVTVKSEDDEEEAGPSQLHQSQTDESREAEPPASSSTVKMETEAAGEQLAGNVDPAADLQPASNGQLLSSHSSDSEADDSEEDMVNKNTSVKQWKCHVCGSSFKERQTLDKHMVIHNREKTFSCPFCGKGFSKDRYFNRHIRVHTGEKPFSCSVCHKRFSDKTYIKVHMTLHTGERPFSCSLCHKSFRDKTNLKVHMRGHTGKKPFSCSECDKSFSDKRSLRRHMQVHTGEKPFSCSVCHKSFRYTANLKVHIRVHTGEKPFSCSVCGRSYSRFEHLKNHKCDGKSHRAGAAELLLQLDCSTGQ
ncbi:zinc finger protein 879-like isoform X2 [Myripristis murdjan]|uniref:zinc finger protein 879-like isoform X2 n=1 Tax=Myripristis murdjan TaxID=586833 RepID=UPI00117640AF|nr:zinc finger protein 879-like isoform X2 [Myripristis murdjan]